MIQATEVDESPDLRGLRRALTAMHGALGTDREAITRAIKECADPLRHGNWIGARDTTGSERWEMLKLTRDILFKYLEWEKSANVKN